MKPARKARRTARLFFNRIFPCVALPGIAKEKTFAEGLAKNEKIHNFEGIRKTCHDETCIQKPSQQGHD
jgi:hypothetical protein